MSPTHQYDRPLPGISHYKVGSHPGDMSRICHTCPNLTRLNKSELKEMDEVKLMHIRTQLQQDIQYFTDNVQTRNYIIFSQSAIALDQGNLEIINSEIERRKHEPNNPNEVQELKEAVRNLTLRVTALEKTIAQLK